VVAVAHLPYNFLRLSLFSKIAFCLGVFSCLSVFSFAQQEEKVEKMPVNQTDSRGKKQGMWYYSVAARMGEPATIEFGSYINGKRMGLWYKVNKSTEDLISIETFKNGMLDGEVTYFEMGKRYCTGHYLALNPSQKYDTIVIVDPVTQEEGYKVLETESGAIRHGTWRYYNPDTGQMIKEEEYAANELVFKKEYKYSVDSNYIKAYKKNLPHNQNVYYKPPPGKRSYTY
jgi:hypothetical protein